ncbi:MAG: ATP-binding cassette domain-containing protein [Bacteroidetes bacterium]|nr:MAG: ATP-binding cassette domain-containing protein [Bacteroidota bacterium]REK05102.1 MAG: ATP-binding cassette domain-containing protein [Bacteroidota bacterium]REK32508.1 MAG: ATP-binding cassette domain-containing protein [Bacteroidota bacterium]REK49045.1 MAG: ATP-binding cassette domain-containing protein [Bacteroidota bacterium]
MDILDINEVSKSYANHLALDMVSIRIPEGSVFGLLGPNGAGKTSLIRIITQITAPDSGTILFRGKPLMREHVNRMGYLPEERGLYKKMEVGEQALYLARLKGLSRSDAMTKLKYWFEKFEIQAWWNKKVEELSKGMAQKVQFVSTILHDPEFLILDEPFTGFDPINAELIKQELLELKKNGTTIVLSTHRMESVEELCSHISLINHAKLILEGPVKDLRKQYKSNEFEVLYSGNRISFTHALWTGFELLDLHEDGEHNVARVKLLGSNTTNDLLHVLLPEVKVLGLREIVPDMNDIFIKTVNDSQNLKEQIQPVS